jgi:hypothetical protein
MRSIAALEDSIHGLSWRRIFLIRNGCAFTWYRRYRMLIPLEEFWSAGNLGIVLAIRRYIPAGEIAGPSLPFPLYLTKCLHHDMALVVRREWSGWGIYERSEARDPSGRRKRIRRTFHTPALEPLPPDELDDTTEASPTQTPRALQTTVPNDDSVYGREGCIWCIPTSRANGGTICSGPCTGNGRGRLRRSMASRSKRSTRR